MTSAAKYRVALTEKLAYAAPAFALAVVGIPVYVYIPKFYTDVVGINITVLGYLLFSVRIFDAVTDPAIGYISDRTQTRFGRRRPYIAVGSILVAVAMFLLFNPPAASPLSKRFGSVFPFTCFFCSGQWWSSPSNLWVRKSLLTTMSAPHCLACATDS